MCRFLLKLERRELIAVVLMSSQKTLVVSITIVGFLGDIGEEGLMTIPCIVAHMAQLFVDSYIASRWANDVDVKSMGETIRKNAHATIADTEAAFNEVDEGGVEINSGTAVQVVG